MGVVVGWSLLCTTWEFVDRAIAALEADPNVDQVDGVPMWQIQQWCDKAIARLEGGGR